MPWPMCSAAAWPDSLGYCWPLRWSVSSSRNGRGELMKIEVDAKMVTIFVNSTDQWHGRPLYSAIVGLCQEKGIAGATVTRCDEGYGAGRELHTTRLLELSENLPVRIEIIDVKEHIDAVLPELEKMVGEGLITFRDVHVIRFLPEPKG